MKDFIGSYTGTGTQVVASVVENGYFIHNHPNTPNSFANFSDTDLVSAATSNQAEISVISQETAMMYTITRPDAGWPSSSVIQTAYDDALTTLYAYIIAQLQSGGMSQASASAYLKTHYDDVIESVATTISATYSEVDVSV
jgi:hypothetical protein